MWPGLRAGCWGRCGLPRKDASRGPGLTRESPWGASGPRGRPGRSRVPQGRLGQGAEPPGDGVRSSEAGHRPWARSRLAPVPSVSAGSQALVLRIHPNGAKKPRSRKDAPPGAARPPLPPSWRSTFSVSSPARRLPVASGGGRSEGVPPAPPWARLVLSRGLDPERSRGC